MPKAHTLTYTCTWPKMHQIDSIIHQFIGIKCKLELNTEEVSFI